MGGCGSTSLHREYWRLRRGANDFALERKHLSEDVQESAGYMGCLDPEFPQTTKPIDIDQEKHLGRRSVWKLQSVVMGEMDLDELTQAVVKGKEKHKNGTLQETILTRGRRSVLL